MKFLFELGVEELPSRYVDISEKALKKEVEKELKENAKHQMEYVNSLKQNTMNSRA